VNVCDSDCGVRKTEEIADGKCKEKPSMEEGGDIHSGLNVRPRQWWVYMGQRSGEIMNRRACVTRVEDRKKRG